MPPLFLRLRWLIVLVVVAGCAAPRYQTTTRYQPPADDAGRVCVAVCAASQDSCRTDCRAAWQACSARIEPEVEPRHAAALRDWAASLHRYREALGRYEWELWLSRSQYYPNPWYQPWPLAPSYVPRPAPPGAEPSREAIRAALLREKCSDDCACQGKYDGCYQACGGRLIPEVQCVANCRADRATDPAAARSQ